MSDGKVVFDITGNTSGIHSALNSATSAIAQQTAKWTVLGQTAMNALVGAAKAGFNAVKDLAKNAFEYNSSMETYEVNFKTLLGSAEAAQQKIVELKEYAARTPFAMSDLADATQTLLAFGVSSADASLALKHLGDISLGDANKLQSLSLAFGQVSSAGKLAGQDLLQMINAGFNPLNVIAEETGAAYADLKAVMSGEKTSEDFQLRMEAARKEVEELGVHASRSAVLLTKIGEDGMISADTVAAAMRIATSEGGMFHKALESASTTTKGQISTIKDSWDMLTGNMFSGLFDNLSAKTLPKIISWLDELNAAFDENGFTGLKTAALRILGEIGGMALDAGANIIAQLYNGITGSDTSAEEIRAYLSEIFGVASDALTGVKDIGVAVLEWIRDNGELVGGAAKTIGIGLGVMLAMSHPLAAALAALGGAIAVFTTDWAAFEQKYPNLVSAFESLTGIDFSDFANGVESAKSKLSAFYNDALAPLFAWLSENGAAMQGILFAIGAAMALMGAPVAGIALMAGVVIANWGDIKAAVESAVTAVNTFFTQTIPATWNSFVERIKQGWTDVCGAIDKGAQAVLNFLGIQVPVDWSMTKAIGAAWDELTAKIDAAIKKIGEFFGLESKLIIGGGTHSSGTHQTTSGSSQGGAGIRFDTTYVEQFIAQFEDEEIEIPVSLATGAEGQIQSELDAMNLTTTVDATVNATVNTKVVTSSATTSTVADALAAVKSSTVHLKKSVGSASSIIRDKFQNLSGIWGDTHASGGIFNSATQFLGEDGMHTFGESGTEVLLPLDALWRKMGMIFDKSLAANLDGLQYSIMPPLPTASPARQDERDMGDAIASAVKEAVSNMTIEMDKRVVGRIVAPEVSKDIANEVNNRKWTA